jgi:hypothetical protein
MMMTQADNIIKQAHKPTLIELLDKQRWQAMLDANSNMSDYGRKGATAMEKACIDAISAIIDNRAMPSDAAMIVALNHACKMLGIDRARRTSIACNSARKD